MATVHKDAVDRIRKQVERRDHEAPIKSVPVSQEENVIFTTVLLDGFGFELLSDPVNDERVRRVFLNRISKRQLTSTRRWQKKSAAPPKRDSVTLSRKFVHEEAFREVAKREGLRVRAAEDTIWVVDEHKRGPEWWKEALVKEEAEVRKRRRLQRMAA